MSDIEIAYSNVQSHTWQSNLITLAFTGLKKSCHSTCGRYVKNSKPFSFVSLQPISSEDLWNKVWIHASRVPACYSPQAA